ncbi:aminotransferase class I/II-fold pyridoxal phosphate-dependent enzyme [Verticiella sediminum]|uniref:Aminotransferase class I/II-fold pyridoxal phosphate-dependent enzyme n=1 Tax=Verticiella sediminum TaxID=1247510 RepID=A0A556B1B8_9BURK|nr:methionine aminotransferase [Verticiella sediminum]TSH98535.1 aminotransferase class I/II-fold pyridoxal phosphate-dependent enzyme [Verticiella sediminum]
MSSSRLPDVGTTIFTIMSQLAIEHGAINLGQGFPDFLPDAGLIDRVEAAMRAGHDQYAPMPGVPALRQAIAAKYQAHYGRSYDPDAHITITSGATQALMCAVFACTAPGDEVIVLEPVYDSYLPSIRLAGAVAVPVAMRKPTLEDPRYRPDWDAVRAAITPRTAAIMINFPHNPTGAILLEEDLDALESLVADSRITLISDEVYEHMVFDGEPHRSLATRPALAERAFVISSFGKALHATGWKIGWCCAPARLTAELRKIHQFMVFSVSTPMQHGIAAFVADPAVHDELPGFYQARRDHLAQGLAATRLRALPCPGTFFMLADYSDVSQLPQQEFVRWLTTEHGVTTIPVSAFMVVPERVEPRIVRLCFAKQTQTLDDAFGRLRAL